jgi:hypothetical protein
VIEEFVSEDDVVQAEPFLPILSGVPSDIEVVKHDDELVPIYRVVALNCGTYPGDWIVRNGSGEIVRVVPPEEFAKTYRRVKQKVR